ncbi:MAG: hypothetical protein IJ568_02580 [Bacilli bacterium]|nr:hypothetical protein [Bacilli bacterium]
MENNEKKKSNIGLIIVIIIIILLLLFAVWFFLLRDKETTNNNNTNNNNTEEKTDNKDEKPTNNTGYEYDYRDGVLTQIVDEEGNPKQTDFVIDGIILIGNGHEYRGDDKTMEIIDYFVEKGYNKEGINSSFYLNEWIEFYIDTKYSGSANDVKIIVTPHKTVEELEKLSLTKLEELANENGGFVLDYKTPEEDNHKYVGNGYVNSDYPVGKYDILFTYKGKLAYFININLAKEPTE